ncbi:1D-myo-inositol 2-acetamido-2-deoxy-alpha-D-glucopyranoside deacetylase [Kocuria subflava]|uniref:1D-myo-inositol 2-acetamido-2-deoxy-alpha-D-glucopyranoside deacetylase n=1 Tax=Kocuria subflava TaxID=1736139 RepID=A0A846TU14_9MICC|nr:1D-myo-inositol 2-acetamido-2-deoxy-alpha-D-glucopyranoside deacetylase [Kocuria subflava]
MSVCVLLVSGHVPEPDRTTDATPSYPQQGAAVLPHALTSVLPAGVSPVGARVLYVHAHPDDETVVTGASMAHLARAGAEVTLLTMTRGERGEVIPADLRHLEVGQPGCTDDGTALGDYRVGELHAACAALGVRSQMFAGQNPAVDPSVGLSHGRDRYLDSGMAWGADGRATAAADVSPAALTAAPVEEVSAHIAAAIRTVRPLAVISYDDDGGYGHPDHIRTAQATMRAVELASSAGSQGGGWNVPMVWAIEGEFVASDARPQAVVRADPADLGAKRAALEAHATQVTLPSDPTELSFAFSNGVVQKISGVETFRMVGGTELSAVTEYWSGAGAGVADAGVAGVAGAGSTAADDPHASRQGRDPLEQASIPVTLTVAGVCGLLAGILGTGVHGNILRLGGLALPWGVLLALALVVSVSVWTGATTRRIWAAAVPGVVAYAVAFALAFLRPDSPLIVLGFDSAIGRVGLAWFGGILLATLFSVVVVGRWWRKRRRTVAA